jgi:hypothetical protein
MIDREEIRRVLLDLRVAYDDDDAVVEDMLRDPQQRELGPVLQRRQHRESRQKIHRAIDYLMRALADRDPPGGGEPAQH